MDKPPSHDEGPDAAKTQDDEEAGRSATACAPNDAPATYHEERPVLGGMPPDSSSFDLSILDDEGHLHSLIDIEDMVDPDLVIPNNIGVGNEEGQEEEQLVAFTVDENREDEQQIVETLQPEDGQQQDVAPLADDVQTVQTNSTFASAEWADSEDFLSGLMMPGSATASPSRPESIDPACPAISATTSVARAQPMGVASPDHNVPQHNRAHHEGLERQRHLAQFLAAVPRPEQPQNYNHGQLPWAVRRSPEELANRLNEGMRQGVLPAIPDANTLATRVHTKRAKTKNRPSGLTYKDKEAKKDNKKRKRDAKIKNRPKGDSKKGKKDNKKWKRDDDDDEDEDLPEDSQDAYER